MTTESLDRRIVATLEREGATGRLHERLGGDATPWSESELNTRVASGANDAVCGRLGDDPAIGDVYEVTAPHDVVTDAVCEHELPFGLDAD